MATVTRGCTAAARACRSLLVGRRRHVDQHELLDAGRRAPPARRAAGSAWPGAAGGPQASWPRIRAPRAKSAVPGRPRCRCTTPGRRRRGGRASGSCGGPGGASARPGRPPPSPPASPMPSSPTRTPSWSRSTRHDRRREQPCQRAGRRHVVERRARPVDVMLDRRRARSCRAARRRGRCGSASAAPPAGGARRAAPRDR